MVMIPDNRDFRARLIETILGELEGSWLAFNAYITRRNEIVANRKVEPDGQNGFIDYAKSVPSISVRRDVIEIELELRKPSAEKVHNFIEPKVNLHQNDQFETQFGLAIVTQSEIGDGGFYWYLTIEIGLSDRFWGSPIAAEDSEH